VLKFSDKKMCENNRENFINFLKSNYNFLKIDSIGKSLCGREIKYLQLGKLKNSVLFVAATHAMEWLTSSLILNFLNYISGKYKNDKKLLGVDLKVFFKKSGLVIIPCLNPDGVEIHVNGAKTSGIYSDLILKASNNNTDFWQSNARGVDLNHNFNAGWKKLNKKEKELGIITPASTRYGGPAPFSEPETFLLAEFCRKNNFRHAVSLHSQGKEIFWNYGKNTPKKSCHINLLMHASSKYKISEPKNLAIGGGFKDWFIKEFKKPAFTIEIGKGKNPLPFTDLPEIFKDLKNTFSLLTII